MPVRPLLVAGLLLVGAVPGQARAAASGPDLVADPAALVDTFVGTTGGGNTFPGADTPFGMMQWSPDTPSRPAGGGYDYHDHATTGFSLTHVAGTGCAVAGAVPFLPTVGPVGADPGAATASFSHAHEHAAPGYYSVGLDSGVTAELTTTTRAGIGKFSYPQGQQANLVVKVAGSATPVSASSVRVVGDRQLTGSVTSVGFCHATNPFTLYFSATFDHPFRAAAEYGGGESVTFDTDAGSVVQSTVGISYVSVANAEHNAATEIPRPDFAATAASAHRAWDALLGRVRIGGGTPERQRLFYTALYHSLLYPNVFSDENGQYPGFDGRVRTAPAGHAQYADFSGWDTYRTQAQLAALLAPTRASDFATSMLADYQQSGTLPKWTLNNAETYVMVGDPAQATLADYYAFGARNFDTGGALAAMLHEAGDPNRVRPGGGYLDNFGYLPTDSFYGCCNFYSGVSTQLEYDTADFALSAFAGALGDRTDQVRFRNRAQDWRNVLNRDSGYFQPRLADGRWAQGFAPSPMVDPLDSNGFAQGDSLIYTGMVPFNVAGLAAAKGGNAAMAGYLDGVLSGFTGPRSAAGEQADLSNEPSFELPWEYDFVGRPYRTQQVVRQALDQAWSDTPDGELGNDDLGTMSAWYVWAALGLYPITPGTADLALGSPAFNREVISLGDGKTITLNAPQAAEDAPYVRGLSRDGARWDRAYLPAAAITDGATLDFTLGTSPDPSWASAPAAAPPSYDGTATPYPRQPTGPIGGARPGACVGPAGDGAHLATRACDGSPAQGWTVAPDGSLRALGKCLDVAHGGRANGTAAQLYACNGTASQQWQVAGRQVRNPQSGRCLTDPGGARLEVDDCAPGDRQAWTLPSL